MRNARRAAGVVALLGVIAGHVHAQRSEAIPPDELAGTAARLLRASRESLSRAPIKIEPDAAKTAGMRGQDEAAIILVAAAGLTDDRITAASEQRTPLGVVYWRNMRLATGNETVPPEQLLECEADDLTYNVALLCARVTDGAPRLEVFGSGDAPLATSPLTRRGSEGDFIGLTLAEIDAVGRRGIVEFTFGRSWVSRLAFAPRE